jgi:hypothetical protein
MDEAFLDSDDDDDDVSFLPSLSRLFQRLLSLFLYCFFSNCFFSNVTHATILQGLDS